MANNYVYVLDGKAYINLTNRCQNACTFCIRNTGDGVAGTPLWLDREPDAADVMRDFCRVRDGLNSREVTFCGYGEPTLALDTLKSVAKALKSAGYTTRLNTNGLGSASAGRDITPELTDIDTVSISLNESDAQKYERITRSEFGANAFGHVLGFAEDCKAAGLNVVFTVVDVIGAEGISECKKLCEKKGIPLRVRTYVPDNYNE